MPERRFSTETWSKEWFQNLDRDQRYLLLYLETNEHCNQAGTYHITLPTMSFETKIPQDELPAIIMGLDPQVKWFREDNIIWVKEFIKTQAFSSTFWQAAAKCLSSLNANGVAKEVSVYNLERYGVSILYDYCMDTVEGGSIPLPLPLSVSLSGSEPSGPGGGSRGGVKDKELATIASEFSENVGRVTPLVAEQLKEIVDNYPAGWFKNALKEAVASGHSSLKYIRAIMDRWVAEGPAQDGKSKLPKVDPDKYIKGKYGHMVRR